MQRFIGLMSGTSLDAIDVVAAEFSRMPPTIAAFTQHPLPDDLRARIRAFAESGVGNLDEVARLDVELGERFADAVQHILQAAGWNADSVFAIGSHGQTLRHGPDSSPRFTWQIGDAHVIAERTGIRTVADFRRRDVAAGGQGAPLAPAFHAALWSEKIKAGTHFAVLNVGGMANLTLLPARPELPVLGFDTGPGNVLLDAWIQQQRGEAFDRDGAWAASTQADAGLLKALLADPYFAQAAPKSTGREHFSLVWLERHLAGRTLSPDTVQATLLELTARSVADALPLPFRKAALRVCGGGAHNQALLRRLQQLLPSVDVASSAVDGVDPDALEALAFAWLARETLAGRPGNLPAVTGASHPVVLGAIYPPAHGGA
jgi:anhydro-N-acetylmuramic acid kinase